MEPRLILALHVWCKQVSAVSVKRKGQAALVGRDSVRQDGLSHRLEAAAPRALQHAVEEEKAEARRRPAKH